MTEEKIIERGCVHCSLCTGDEECYLNRCRRLEQENKELKEEKSKLLDKSLEKQCRINELLNICSTKEFILKVNGKKYSGLNGIDKAKLFINNENAVRDKYIKKLEAEISDTQWKFADAHKKINTYRSALEEINRVIKLAHKVEDYSLGQDYTDLVDRMEKEINEVLK